MKYIHRLNSITLLLTLLLMSHYVYPFKDNEKGSKRSVNLLAAHPNSIDFTKRSGFTYLPDNGFRGNLAYAHNAWTYEIFTLDVDNPTTITILDTVDFQTFCGDFEPGNDEQLWVIQYPENILKTINVEMGTTQFEADLPVPMAGGVWSSLSIHKTTGDFYAIATDGFESILYSVDKSTGSTVELFALGLQAVISATFDAGGAFYMFEIETDSTYTLDLSTGIVTGIGPAGFDGNFAQGMAYDPVDDEIYLSAYEDLVGPQLRKLNRMTGEAEFLSMLPGETAAFSFPVGNILPSGIDFGDAPEITGSLFSFSTTLANNGAAHNIDPSIFLGTKIDGEPDGQPDSNAKGDDNDLLYPSMGDDEDGVELSQAVYQGTETSINVTASVNGYLDVWMDFDLDHSWFNPAEHIFNQTPILEGVNTLTFTIPPTAVSGQSFLRFRFRDYPLPLSFDGMANNGEVEDYVVEIKSSTLEDFDYGDAPQGYGKYNFRTTLSSDGARHKLKEGVFLGTFVDAEPDGQPVANALGDDNDLYFPSQGDDEDGVSFPQAFEPGITASIVVQASVAGYLDAWMDFDQSGTWAETDEHVFITQPLTAGTNTLSLDIPENAAPGFSHMRFRFRDYNEPLSWFGMADNGEIEDYRVQILAEPTVDLDFGDAPAGFVTGGYPTLLANNGARHKIDSLVYLGAMVDAEPNGQSSINATGDDTDMFYPSSGDDEDGVSFSGPMIAGLNATVTIVASTDGFLSAWIDYNIDGTWNNGTERIFNAEPLFAGTNEISINIPEDIVSGVSFARFRFQSFDTPLSFDGLAEDGEVEDYAVQIQVNSSTGWDFGDAPGDLYPTSLLEDGARHFSDGTTFLGSLIDTEADAISSASAKGDDLNNLDDEDGIVFQNSLFAGGIASLQITTSSEGYLNAWIDYSVNNSWADAGEQIFNDYLLSSGLNYVSFAIPDSVTSGETFLRFRFSSQTGLSFTGPAENGEVEDYMVTIYPDWNATPTPLMHTITVPAGLPPLQNGDLLGLFFTDNSGTQQCAGSMVYGLSPYQQMLAFGDNPTTPEVKEGFAVGEALAWKLFSPQFLSEFDLDVLYDSAFPDFDGTFRPNGFSALVEANYQQNPCEMPSDWEYTITGLSHNLNIPVISAPTIFGEPLENGDWIGAFYMDDDGNEDCGGAVQWNGAANAVLTAYGDDPLTDEKDGFEAGETLNWKLFRCESNETFSAIATYNGNLPCQGSFGNFCLSELTSLNALYVQTIFLFQGWNSLSTYVVPLHPDVEDIFAPFQGELTIIQNLSSLYWPYAGVNTIGDWDNESGYAIKVTDDIELDMKGSTEASRQITLSSGWHYLPVLSSCPVNADELLVPVVDKITLVQDIIGTKVWWPEMGVYSLQVLLPGKAYKIKLEEAVTLTFPDCDYKSYIKPSTEQTRKSVWGDCKMSPSSHTLSFLSSSVEQLKEGDWIGAYDSQGNLCGYLEVEADGSNQTMVVFGDDISTEAKDGFDEGELLQFKVYRSQNEEELELNVIYADTFDYSGTFKNGGISAISEIKLSPLSSDESIPKNSEVLIYPNPSNGLFHVEGLGNATIIEIFDVFGKVVYQGEISLSGDLQLSDQAKGVYFVRIENNANVHFERLVIQ